MHCLPNMLSFAKSFEYKGGKTFWNLIISKLTRVAEHTQTPYRNLFNQEVERSWRQKQKMTKYFYLKRSKCNWPAWVVAEHSHGEHAQDDLRTMACPAGDQQEGEREWLPWQHLGNAHPQHTDNQCLGVVKWSTNTFILSGRIYRLQPALWQQNCPLITSEHVQFIWCIPLKKRA